MNAKSKQPQDEPGVKPEVEDTSDTPALSPESLDQVAGGAWPSTVTTKSTNLGGGG